jgi:hypothetical protein
MVGLVQAVWPNKAGRAKPRICAWVRGFASGAKGAPLGESLVPIWGFPVKNL